MAAASATVAQSFLELVHTGILEDDNGFDLTNSQSQRIHMAHSGRARAALASLTAWRWWIRRPGAGPTASRSCSASILFFIVFVPASTVIVRAAPVATTGILRLRQPWSL